MLGEPTRGLRCRAARLSIAVFAGRLSGSAGEDTVPLIEPGEKEGLGLIEGDVVSGAIRATTSA